MGVLVKMTSFLLLSLLCTLASCSPVVEVQVEDRGLLSDIALGMLVGKIQEMLGITTTPAPRPIIDGIFGILGGDTATTTAAPPTDEEKMGLLQSLFGLFFPSDATTTTTTTPAPTTTKCGGTSWWRTPVLDWAYLDQTKH